MNDTNVPQSGSSRTGKMRSAGRIVLAVSLALNFAVLGVIAGAALRGNDVKTERVREAQQNRDLGLGPFIGALDQEGRRKVGRAFVLKAGGPQAAREDARKNIEATLNLLKSEAFDEERFRTRLKEHQTRFTQQQAVGMSVLTDYLVGLSLEERRAYVEKLEASMARMRGERGGDRAGGHGDSRISPAPAR